MSEKKPTTIEELDTKLDKKFDELALMIGNGFANTASKKDFEVLDEKIDKLDEKVTSIDDRLKVVETKLDRALYTELVHIEARIRRLEERAGIKSPDKISADLPY